MNLVDDVNVVVLEPFSHLDLQVETNRRQLFSGHVEQKWCLDAQIR